MKFQMSSLDIKAAVAECQPLTRGRIAKVLAGKSKVALAVHVSEKGKKWIGISVPGFVFMTDEKPVINGVSPFQSALKKHLEGGRLISIEQPGFERAVILTFETKEGIAMLAAELFAPGNAVLCCNDKVLMLLKKDLKKNQEIGAPYKPPIGRRSMWEMDSKEIEEILSASNDPVSEVLAKNGLGAVWAKEVCLRAGLDLQKKSSPLDAKDIEKALREIKNEPLNPQIVFEGDAILDVKPFPLKVYGSNRQQPCSMGEGIAQVIASHEIIASRNSGHIDKVENILERQRKYLAELNNDAKENARKGELIFEKYQVVKEVLDELKKARPRLPWKEIKARLNDHPLIKEINEAKGEITIEL